MSVSQTLLATEYPQTPAASEYWGFYCPNSASIVNQANYATSPAFWPGTQDFCFETWIYINDWLNAPAIIAGWGSGGQAAGPGASNFALVIDNAITPGLYTFRAYVLGQVTTPITGVMPAVLKGTWAHLAMSRIGGDTINVWWNGQQYGNLTGVAALDLSYANVGGDGWWFSSGPVGDRDQTYANYVDCEFRNMRWTIGNSVYPDSYNITPPSFDTNIAPVTGTQWIWWPASNTYAGAFIPWGNNTWSPDYNPNSLGFAGSSGSSATITCDVMPFVYPNTPMTPYFLGDISSAPGTWTNNGTGGAQPTISNAVPPIIGATCGDFTATGTNVNISSTDAQPYTTPGYGDINGNNGTIYLWFYVPSNITNECKNLFNVEAANGLCINIGTPGGTLDWLSITTFEGVVKSSGQHIWARDQWNYVAISRDQSMGGLFYAWAGNATQTYAQQINMVDNGSAGFGFGLGGTVTIGSLMGSNVSCQMYIGQIAVYTGYFNNNPPIVWDHTLTQIPVQNFTTRAAQSTEMFTFQGTPGATNIQPGGF